MAYPAVIELKRLASTSRKRSYTRRKYSLEKAEELVQELIGKIEGVNLYELTKKCLSNTKARKELTDIIYHMLIEHGIDVSGTTSVKEAAHALYAEMYGYSVFQKYMDDPTYNEVYTNAPDDCWGIIGLERYPIPVQFRDEKHAQKVLARLTENSREGKAAHDNRLNSTVLPDRSRLRWALPPVSDSVGFNIRKHTVEDMKSIMLDKYLDDGVMTKSVFSLLVGMAITGTCYMILGPGAIGKTALLRVILKEVHETISPRFLISENGAELNLKEYLLLLGCEKVDVHSLQKWSGDREGLAAIFANFMQAKGEFIIQPEVLMPEEVDNILMANRRGHVMGPSTFHSYPKKLLDALTDLYLQRYPSDRESVKRTLSDDILASCHYDVEYTSDGKKRRIIGVYEHVNGKAKPIYLWNPTSKSYEIFLIENEELKQKLANLEYVAPSIYQGVKHLL
ncbi:MAG TPA: ATPase, T2SS/T4P/T4SS family [Bacillota bacterium]|nr:ATPase, T2SS/T4P/T4SS family [Bacillota bacterium]